jgi:predicted transcriptional regulator
MRLGELETAVLERLWADGPADVKSVHQAIGASRRITLNTVQSTMERLYRKRLLARDKVSHAYVYRPQVTRQDLVAAAVNEVIERLGQGRTAPVLSAFVDVAARAGSDSLARLEKLVAERRASGKKR